MVAMEIMNTSFRMDTIPMGGEGINIGQVKREWREDIEKCISNRREIFVIP